MFKLKKMVTILGLILLGVLLITSFSGANPSGQARPIPPIKIDSSTPIPTVFLEQALKDSITKLNVLTKSNDSLVQVRRHKSDKILRLIHNMVHRKRTITIVDTVYVPQHFVFDTAFNKDFNYLIHLN